MTIAQPLGAVMTIAGLIGRLTPRSVSGQVRLRAKEVVVFREALKVVMDAKLGIGLASSLASFDAALREVD